jgi:hypothetical protein
MRGEVDRTNVYFTLHLVAIAIQAAISAPCRGQKGGATTYKHVVMSFTRALFENASMEQLQ